MNDGWTNIVLVLSGGAALGSFQAGAYAALHEHGLRPTLIAGTSIGAVNGVLIAANAEDRRLSRLSAFWSEAALDNPLLGSFPAIAGRLTDIVQTRLWGRRGLFDTALPRLFDAVPIGRPALYRTDALGRTLAGLADFDRLGKACPLIVLATDLNTGDPVAFHSHRERIGPEHIRASTALPGDFEPIELNGRLLGDGGLTANLPIGPALSFDLPGDTLCIALDLYSGAARKLQTLDDFIQRRTDALFANQSMQSIEIERRRYIETAQHDSSRGAVMLVRVVYAGGAFETSQKEFDYSASSVRRRWVAGVDSMRQALAQIEQVRRPKGWTYVEVCGAEASADRNIGAAAPTRAP
jgi:NTE family protein